MKKHLRTFACVSIVTLAIFFVACGGSETMASKSAAAYREAQTKGTPAGGADGHGHAAAASESAMQDHSAHGATTETADSHAGMSHATSSEHTTMDHSAGVEHSAHGSATDHAAMDHSTPTSHAGHAAAVPADAHAAQVDAPSSSSATAAVRPAATLTPDDFDAPAAKSVAESAKASGGAHSMNHDIAPQNDAAEIYSCPMHPEVTSATPGQCPKCGMTLVKRNRQ